MKLRNFFAAALICAVFAAAVYAAESPEALYNRANEQAAIGDSAAAIDLFYRVIEDYPKFTYAADAMYRLGNLLYRTERYEESERVFNALAGKFKNYKHLDKVYEKLIHIYVEVYPDNAKADAIRDRYKKRFGITPVLTAIDKTLTILKSDEQQGAKILALDAHLITAGRVSVVSRLEKEVFPLRNYILAEAYSADRKYMVKKDGGKKQKNLVIYNAAGKKVKVIKQSAGGQAPQWSWDGRYIGYTILTKNVRKIMVYDVKKNKVRKLFSGKNVEPMLLFSPEGGKIVFIYNGNPWIMEKTGNNISFLGTVKLKKVVMAAWSQYGEKLIFMQDGRSDFNLIVLERKRLLMGGK
ncbi:MAG: hypothetical protein CVV21_01900 [Candidatus Goldiibacteriota bacterium HGW-Goldbacteria-1]|jgi:tetratricopeptide (TPR) repeat protein|nr:MAG: hypothetical protein CVV21_01900 [Candidatus Goldiibacteriota bacterium HGW-Goldbacteria-1]